MAGVLQVQVVDRQQIVFTADFNGPVELGRQNDAAEPIYAARERDASHWRSVLTMLPEPQRKECEDSLRKTPLSRVAIAQLNEDTVSRHHALLEPLGGNRVRVSNISAKVPIRLPDDRELLAGKSIELDLPTALVLGKKTIRARTPETRSSNKSILAMSALPADTHGSSANIRRLDQPSIAPGQLSMALTRFPTLTAAAAADNVQVEEMIRWLQNTIGVLQASTNSTDFFERAAQAVVENIGCDRGAVLLLRDNEWHVEELRTGPSVQLHPDWQPSTSLLGDVLREKKTSWKSPEQGPGLPESLFGVEIAVASPILGDSGEVIGAIYGDCEFDPTSGARTRISKLDALLVDMLASSVATGLARLAEERRAVEADVRFGQFFTAELSRELTRNPDLLKGRDEDVTLVFVDIRGFSRISEKLGPAGTVEWIGDVMNELSDCVLKHRGVLVDYIGDELMAMWGAPEAQPDHPLLACRAALDMLAALPRISERWQEKVGEPVRLGIGINTGRARVGNTGSRHKFKYGPLGHHVNLASRVQGATKYLRTPLLITEFTRSRLDDEFDLRRLCTVRVVNIAQPVGLYELVAPGQPAWAERKQDYEEALREFEQGPDHLRQACRALGNLVRTHTEDGPALLLMARALNILNDPDPPPFDPVWELPGK